MDDHGQGSPSPGPQIPKSVLQTAFPRKSVPYKGLVRRPPVKSTLPTRRAGLGLSGAACQHIPSCGALMRVQSTFVFPTTKKRAAQKRAKRKAAVQATRQQAKSRIFAKSPPHTRSCAFLLHAVASRGRGNFGDLNICSIEEESVFSLPQNGRSFRPKPGPGGLQIGRAPASSRHH